MCIFVTCWVNEDVDSIVLQQVLKENGFGYQEYPDSPIRKKLGCATYFRASQSWCDCSTELGSEVRKPNRNNSLVDQIARLRRKGWKESKISRWIKEKEETEEKSIKGRNEKNKRGDISPTNEKWIQLIVALLAIKKHKSFGLIYHAYHGDQTTEDFEVKPKTKLNLDEIQIEELGRLESETPYEIIKIKPKW